MKKIYQILDFIEQRGLYPEIKVMLGAPGPKVKIEGRDMYMFCTNDYLSLATHPDVIQASIEATKKFGTGAGSARLMSGTTDMHVLLEKEIAEFKGRKGALVFSSGYLANVGTITGIMKPLKVNAKAFFERRGIVISDELNHASIIDGSKLADTKTVIYKHCDIEDLERKLKRYKNRRKLIVTDGVFSMDGDIAPLPDIAALAKRFDALTMVDDAHGTGILGKSGHGTSEHFGLEGQIDIEIGTFNKVFGGVGGYVSGDDRMCKYLRVAARPYMFSAAMPPGVAAALVAAIRVVKKEPALRQKLMDNAKYMKEELSKKRFDFLGSQTQIIPVMIGDEEKAIRIAKKLFDRGFFVPCVRWPAVPKGRARLRVTVMSAHEKEHIDAFVAELVKLWE